MEICFAIPENQTYSFRKDNNLKIKKTKSNTGSATPFRKEFRKTMFSRITVSIMFYCYYF